MNKTVLSIDAKASAPKERFHAREFRRMVAVCLRFPKPLALGLACTVVFACLHTLSIGVAFPVFKVLLEEEGIGTWADRTVAGHRLSVAFTPPGDALDLRLATLSRECDLYSAGLREGDRIRDPRGRPATEFLHDLAYDNSLDEVIVATGVVDPGATSKQRHISVAPRPLSMSMNLLRWAAAWIPPDAERDKIRVLGFILVGLTAIIVLANVFRYLGEVWIAKAILSAMMQLRTDLFDRTLHLPMRFFASKKTSDMVGRFVQDMQEIQRGMLTLFSKFIREPLRAVLVLGFAFMLDWRLTLTVMLATPAAVFIFWRIGRRVKRSNRKLLQAYGDMIGALTTSLQNLRVVKAYTAEERERERLREVDQRVFHQQLKLARLQALVSPAIETISIMACSVLTLWLANQVLNREMEISKFATLGVALSVLFDPIRKLTDVYVRVQRSTAGAERIFSVIDEDLESDAYPAHLELKPLEESIEYRGVSFTYPNAETPALNDVSLSIRRGETVALVGPNGCGKTTLVSMLLRLYVPDTGEIRYDGRDIREATLPSLRRQISLVTQEAVVFGTTPAENIAYGPDGADPSRVRDAARRASADEFIEAIPGGYDAELSERGMSLSGGQRQRLAIARAIFRDAPILIFDEATSQVDSESEQKIQQAIQEFSKGRTTIIIAHRLSTIQYADRIIVMDGGRIIDTGTHKELFDRCPLYRNLCETQLFVGAASSDA